MTWHTYQGECEGRMGGGKIASARRDDQQAGAAQVEPGAG